MPFLVNAVLVGVGLFIRLRLSETPAFRQLQARHEISRAPIWKSSPQIDECSSLQSA